MNRSSADFEATYEAELQALWVERLRALLRFALLMYPSFFALDLLLADPIYIPIFLTLRLSTMAVLGGVLLSLRHEWGWRWAQVSSWLVLLVASGTIAVMSVMLGGFDSDYYVGIVFCMIVCDRFLPWSPREVLWLGGLVIAFYFVTQLALVDGLIDPGAFASAVAFMVGTQVFFVSASVADQRRRRHELGLRLDLERAGQELRVASDARSRFLANVSHELRTPLSLILAPLEVLRGGREADRPALYAAMESNARRLLRQVNMLLEFARLDGGGPASNPARGGLAELVLGLIEAARPRAEGKDLRLTAEGLESLPETTYDKDALETILANLLSNALKFTPAGGAVCVRAGVQESALWLEVEDDGIGIAGSMQRAIFQRFIQVDNAASRSFEGSGMGLALVRELAEGQGGRVSVDSEPGRGSCFRVELPRSDLPGRSEKTSAERSTERLITLLADGEEASNLPAGALWAPPPTADAHLQARPRVLLAEDSADMSAFLAAHLALSYEVEVTSNGAEALRSALIQRPDILVTDVMMPELDGLELCRRVRQEESLRGLPIILVTARGDSEDLVRGFEAGASDYISKPLVMRELDARIEALLRAESLERGLLERELRLAAVGRSASMVVHDLRNPLANIFALLELAGLKTEGFESSREGQLLSSESQRLSRMLGEILDFARGKVEVQLESVDVESFVTGFLELIARRGVLEGIEVTTDVTLAEPLSVELDRQRVFRVLENLLLNAVEALAGASSERRGIWLSVDRSEPWLRFRIADNGPGLPEGSAKTLFEPFVTRGKQSGTGLGLAMARETALAHGGRIECQATCEHGGAAFVLSLPLTRPSESSLHERQSVLLGSGVPRRSSRWYAGSAEGPRRSSAGYDRPGAGS